MGKKLKLDLKEFRVQSFVSSLKDDEQDEVKGGGDTRFCPSGQYSGCPCTQYTDCGTCYLSCYPTCSGCV
jgi:hypothetical protein